MIQVDQCSKVVRFAFSRSIFWQKTIALVTEIFKTECFLRTTVTFCETRHFELNTEFSTRKARDGHDTSLYFFVRCLNIFFYRYYVLVVCYVVGRTISKSRSDFMTRFSEFLRFFKIIRDAAGPFYSSILRTRCTDRTNEALYLSGYNRKKDNTPHVITGRLRERERQTDRQKRRTKRR